MKHRIKTLGMALDVTYLFFSSLLPATSS